MKKTDSTLDNGQHLFMGCYSHTFNFLKKINTFQHLKFQKNLTVDFVRPDGKISSLFCRPWPAPFHLASGLWSLDTLNFKEKWSMLKVYRALKSSKGHGGEGKTVDQWLIGLGQTANARKYFWDPITYATLNETPSVAEASSLAIVLKEAFFSSPEKSQIAISTVGLSNLCGPESEKFIHQKGGSIQNHQLVSKINVVGDSVRGVVMRDGKTLTADLYISALPFFVLKNLLSRDAIHTEFFSKLNALDSSPIFSISIWFDRPITEKTFVGMLDTQVHWLFNKGKYVSLVISGARELLTKTNEEITKLCLDELHQCFPESRSAELKHVLIQREKNATLSPKVGVENFRLPQKTPIRNFLLCGDWTQTGFPATIESAVLSGQRAAELASV